MFDLCGFVGTTVPASPRNILPPPSALKMFLGLESKVVKYLVIPRVATAEN
jgi:hypothetical protein